MPYVKQVKRFNTNKEHIKSDYYLAEQIMIGKQRTENIIRALTPEQVKSYSENTERNQDELLEVTEHTEHPIIDTQILRKLIPLFVSVSDYLKQEGLQPNLDLPEIQRIQELAKEGL